MFKLSCALENNTIVTYTGNNFSTLEEKFHARIRGLFEVGFISNTDLSYILYSFDEHYHCMFKLVRENGQVYLNSY